MPQTVYAIDAYGSMRQTRFSVGMHSPFYKVFICCGGMHDREESYHFTSKSDYEHWRGRGPHKRGDDPPPCTRPFTLQKGILEVDFTPPRPSRPPGLSTESDSDSMPELESVDTDDE